VLRRGVLRFMVQAAAFAVLVYFKIIVISHSCYPFPRFSLAELQADVVDTAAANF
jgi:hypothetical protein